MTSNTLSRRLDLLGSAPLFYEEPIEIVRGDGVYLFDQNDKQYIDLYNNVPCVGHGNQRVADAVHQQLGKLNVHSRYLNPEILNYAERMIGTHSANIDQVVFACSGTEASEIALMMARTATRGVGIVCSDATYHGNSTEVLKMYRPVTDPHFRSIPFPQSYRDPSDRRDDESLTDYYLARLQGQIDDFADKQIPFAGLMLCSILANEGLPVIPDGFMAKAADVVHKAGGLVIADEVQAGFCRSGKWWGYEHSEFLPDIVTAGKPLGNGVPISAVFASKELVGAFRMRTRYFNTTASSPLQAAAGMAVLDEIEERGLLEKVAYLGDYLTAELSALQPESDRMGDVRGCGLFIGVEWVKDKASKEIDVGGAVDLVSRLKAKGFLTGNAGAGNNVLKVRPPLAFEKPHADLFLTAFREVLKDVS
jgi:4-aminobutyrate aminotransferase-like enzyme